MSVEQPPQYSKDSPDIWPEDIIDYLIRALNKLDKSLNDLEARIEALEP